MEPAGKMAFIERRLKHASADTVDTIFRILDCEVPDPMERYLGLSDLCTFYEKHPNAPQTPPLAIWRQLTELRGMDVRDQTNCMHRAGLIPRRSTRVANLVVGLSGVQKLPKSTLQRMGITDWVASYV